MGQDQERLTHDAEPGPLDDRDRDRGRSRDRDGPSGPRPRRDGAYLGTFSLPFAIVDLYSDEIVTSIPTVDPAIGRWDAIPAAPQPGQDWLDTAWHEIAHVIVASILWRGPSRCLGAWAWSDDRRIEEGLALDLGRQLKAAHRALARAYPGGHPIYTKGNPPPEPPPRPDSER